jgi:putative serine protease PepD
VSDALPPLEPRPRADGLPPLGPRPEGSSHLPPLQSSGADLPPPDPADAGTRELPPIGHAAAPGAPPPPPRSPRARPAAEPRPSGRRAGTAVFVTLAVLGAGVVGGLSARAFDGDDPAPAAVVETPAAVTTPSAPSTDGSIADEVSRAAPAVVQVQSSSGQGSGVIVEPSGLVVTNNHVIRGDSTVTLVTSDDRRVAATVVAADERQDLAILRPEGAVGRGAELAEETDGGLRQGDRVFAIGSPFGLQGTVTAGVVSAVGRTNEEGVPMIQIDAPINPGNSGGGLFDLRGRLVGIPTSILGPISGNVGIGFAVPVSRVRAMLDAASGSSTPSPTPTP